MKKYLVFFLIFREFIINAQVKEQAVSIVPRQVHHLYNALHPSSDKKNKLVIPVKLPPNTIRWFYTFSAFRKQSDIQNQRNVYKLFSQLSKLIDETGTTAFATNYLTEPPGNDNCSVYLLGSAEDVTIFENYTQLFSKDFSYYDNYSKNQFVSGIVPIGDQNLITGTQYIGIRNKDSFYDIDVSIEVVAIIAKTSISDIQKNSYTKGYNEGYNTGYLEGYSKGNSNGSDEGYKKGYNESYNIGYGKGYKEGENKGHSAGFIEGLNYKKYRDRNRFGLKGGVNLARINQNKQSSDMLLSYNQGLLYNILLSKRLSIQPEILHTIKGAAKGYLPSEELKIQMIELPVLLKYKFAGWHTKYFVNGGFYGAYLLNTNDIKPSETTIEYGVVGGLGVEIPNLGEGKLLIEARYDYGLGFSNKNTFPSSDFHTNVIGISVGFLF